MITPCSGAAKPDGSERALQVFLVQWKRRADDLDRERKKERDRVWGRGDSSRDEATACSHFHTSSGGVECTVPSLADSFVLWREFVCVCSGVQARLHPLQRTGASTGR